MCLEEDVVIELCGALFKLGIFFKREHRVCGGYVDVMIFDTNGKPRTIIEVKRTQRPRFGMSIQCQRYKASGLPVVLCDGFDRIKWTVALIQRGGLLGGQLYAKTPQLTPSYFATLK
jgi:hypothetical protein